MDKSEQLHALINIRAGHITQPNGQPKWDGYRRAYEAIKHSRWKLQNLLGRMRQGGVGDGNYGRGLG